MRSQDDDVDIHDSMLGIDPDATGDGRPALMTGSLPTADGDIDMEKYDDAVSDSQSLSDTGSVTNAPTRTDDDWKYSVRVNVASSTRSSIVLSSSSQDLEEVAAVQKPRAETEAAGNARKQPHDTATVRVLREPGDSGKSVYDCLYGGESVLPMTTTTTQHTEIAQLSDQDQHSTTDMDVSQAEQNFDVEMDEADAGERSLLPEDAFPVNHVTGEEAEQASALLSDFTTDDLNPGADEIPKRVQLFDTLPDIHEYFSHGGSSEDVRILNLALTNVRTTDVAVCTARTPLLIILLRAFCVAGRG